MKVHDCLRDFISTRGPRAQEANSALKGMETRCVLFDWTPLTISFSFKVVWYNAYVGLIYSRTTDWKKKNYFSVMSNDSGMTTMISGCSICSPEVKEVFKPSVVTRKVLTENNWECLAFSP